ncbi:MAG: sodium-dependent transporter [Gammaproteobacteria bacterium]
MTEKRTSMHGQWSSRWAFILAATGSAVGLGNIWRFPYIAGENGGGAFVLVYLLCVLLVGIPIMVAEIMLGRRGRQSPINTMRTLAAEEGYSSHWQYLGWMGVVAGFLILSFYSVVAGWTLAYIFRTGAGMFHGAAASDSSRVFNELIQDPERLLAWHTIFMGLTAVVVARGVKSGLEQAVRYLMPTLFILLVVLVGYAMGTEGFARAVTYLFKPDFSSITPSTLLTALGQAFFSLSLGMGAIMTYGSYLTRKASILRMACAIAAADSLVAILAGLAIFPIVFTYGLEPGEGSGLVFKTLPIAFGQMPFGSFFGAFFFVLLMFAGWTSSISLLEPAVAWLVENHGLTRVKASCYAAILAWVLGMGSLLSLNIWSDKKLFNLTFFNMVESITANIMLPVGGLLIAVFGAWLMSQDSSFEELNLDKLTYGIWRFIARYIAPAGVILIFLQAIGVFRNLT